jgi:7-cyano-7-deazaguanine synthase
LGKGELELEKAVILLSGGVDSSTGAYWGRDNGWELHALSLDYGHKATYEIECASKIAESVGVKSHKRVDLNALSAVFASPLVDKAIIADENDRDGDSYYVVPLRNIVFLSVASAYAQSIGAKHVIIGNHLGDAKGFPDCRPEAMAAMQEVVNVASEKGKELTLHSPYLHINKDEIIAQGLKLGVPYEHTYSCYADSNEHCGVCESCEYRYEAFLKAGTVDPAPYAVIPTKK